eukprot:5447204-Pleurochrysis_carterae.AAC.1
MSRTRPSKTCNQSSIVVKELARARGLGAPTWVATVGGGRQTVAATRVAVVQNTRCGAQSAPQGYASLLVCPICSLLFNFIPDQHAFARARCEAGTHADSRRPRPAATPRARPRSGHASLQASQLTRCQLVAPRRCKLDPFFSYPLRSTASDMPDTNNPDTVSHQPSWDSSHLSQERAWLYDLLPWLPTRNASYASLVEHGYILTPQGRVVVYSYQHAQAVFFNLYTLYAIDAPSPIAPTYTFLSAPAAAAASGPTTRSTPA